MRPAIKWFAGLTLAVVAGAFLLPSSASASSSGPGPGPQVSDPSNWGKTPEVLRVRFAEAEEAARMPGLGQALAVWAFSVGKGSFVPNAKNQSAQEVAQSEEGFDRYPDWPMGLFGPEWRSGGSWGLFDLLAGTHARAGYQDGGFAPLVDHPVDSLRRVDVQLYIVGWICYRLIKGPYPVLVAGDPGLTWANIRAAAIDPSAYLQKTQASAQRIATFYTRAAELGIDPSRIAMPSVKDWPGAKGFYERLAVFDRVDDTLSGVLA